LLLALIPALGPTSASSFPDASPEMMEPRAQAIIR
jgi:hypothetical protein